MFNLGIISFFNFFSWNIRLFQMAYDQLICMVVYYDINHYQFNISSMLINVLNQMIWLYLFMNIISTNLIILDSKEDRYV